MFRYLCIITGIMSVPMKSNSAKAMQQHVLPLAQSRDLHAKIQRRVNLTLNDMQNNGNQF